MRDSSLLPSSCILLPCTFVLVASLAGGCVIPKSVGDGRDEDGDGGSSSVGMTGPLAGATNTSSGGETGLDPTTGGGTELPGGTDPGGSESTSLNFLMTLDGGIYDPCDLWQQDCPRGEKCVPWANDGGDQWNEPRCSPIVDDPDAVGEPCTIENSPTSGLDTCVFGAMCFADESLEGTCVALCAAPEDSPTCAAGTTCLIANDGVLPLCLTNCDPLLQDCADGHTCHPSEVGFVCIPDGGGGMGGAGEACESIAMCDHGFACVEPQVVPDCASLGCCTAFCDLNDPMPPCLPAQVCTPWYESGMAPAGFEDVGFCSLPL